MATRKFSCGMFPGAVEGLRHRASTAWPTSMRCGMGPNEPGKLWGVGVTPKCSYQMPQLKHGERGRNRTYNLLIKSQLLCQLSYAPTVGILAGRTNKNYSIRLCFSQASSSQAMSKDHGDVYRSALFVQQTLRFVVHNQNPAAFLPPNHVRRKHLPHPLPLSIPSRP